MKTKFIDYYMGIAELTSKLSYAKRLQVGAVIVKGNQIIGTGYNGMPTGWDNNCENRVYNTRFKQQTNGEWMDIQTYQIIDIDEHYPFSDDDNSRYYLKTKPEVLHAEMNCLMKVAQSTESSKDSVLFTTTAPCMDCSKLIYQSGIKSVYYRDSYRSDDGLTFLKQGKINVHRYPNSL